MSVVDTGLHACLMTDRDHIVKELNLITANGAKALGIKEYGVKVGNKAGWPARSLLPSSSLPACNTAGGGGSGV